MKWVFLLAFFYQDLCRADLDLQSRGFMPQGTGSTPDLAIESGRYQVKGSGPKTVKSSPSKSVAKKRVVVKEPDRAPAAVVEEPSDITEEKMEASSPEINSEATWANYDKNLHPEDVRRNRIDFAVLPSLLSLESKSDSWYRNFNFVTPAFKVDLNAWILPSFGLHADYLTSVGADMPSTPQPGNRTGCSYESVSFGVRSRHYYGVGRKSPSLEVGLSYVEQALKVPSDEAQRSNTKTSGFDLSLVTRWPESPRYASLLGVKWAPRQTHSESGTKLDLHSGDKVDTVRFGLTAGGEILLRRSSQVVWNIDFSLERNVFTGISNKSDPVTTSSYSNISVSQTVVLFSLGYRWAEGLPKGD